MQISEVNPMLEAKPVSDREIRKVSFRDGISHALMLGTGENYLGVFGIFLKATESQVGALASIPSFVGALAQLIAVRLVERTESRRAIILTTANVQALLWLPMAALPFAYQLDRSVAVTALILLVSLYYISAGIIAPVWSSLVGDIIPPATRGEFFGTRNTYIGLATFLGVSFAGGILQWSDKLGHQELGFLAIFLVAAAARLASTYWISRYPDPRLIHSAEHRFSFLDFIRRSPYSNFAKFVFFVSMVNFATFIASPFFSLYLLRDLQFSYMQFTIIAAGSTVIQFVAMQHWGKLSDIFGNKKILALCGYGVGLVPLFWLMSTNFFFLLFVQLYAGFVWAGFNLAAGNFMFDAVTAPKRARCVAYQSIVNGACLLAGSTLGSQVDKIIPRMNELLQTPIEFRSNLLVLFLISGILRIVATRFWITRFDEVRSVPEIRHRDLIFRVAHLRPLSGATFALFTGISKEEESEPE